MSFEHEMVRFAKKREKELAATHDLATWLPSYYCAKKHHGDY